MAATRQQMLFADPKMKEALAAYIKGLAARWQQPSANELLLDSESKFGVEARWELLEVVNSLSNDAAGLTQLQREYLRSLLGTGSLAKALRGEDAPDKVAVSSIDLLLARSRQYATTAAFQEMVEFVGRFRDYSPYNNMLVKIQNPSCSFYATAKDWQHRFNRTIKDDVRAMLILAPMHPVMVVFRHVTYAKASCGYLLLRRVV